MTTIRFSGVTVNRAEFKRLYGAEKTFTYINDIEDEIERRTGVPVSIVPDLTADTFDITPKAEFTLYDKLVKDGFRDISFRL